MTMAESEMYMNNAHMHACGPHVDRKSLNKKGPQVYLETVRKFLFVCLFVKLSNSSSAHTRKLQP